MTQRPKTVLIAGATGYLGRHLLNAYADAGFHVLALARRPDALADAAITPDRVIQAEVTEPDSLAGKLQGVDLVVSAVGITRQRDGLSYDDVDYRANRNLLDAALAADVGRFAYVHVLNAEQMPNVAMVRAKERFAQELAAAPIASTILMPSGFFSDLQEVLTMASQGRVYLFGDGAARISPIHGADMAAACVSATTAGLAAAPIGGPESFTQNEIAELAFDVLERPSRVSHVPLWLGKLAVAIGSLVGLKKPLGPLEFFLAVSGIDMTAPAHGRRRLGDAFRVKDLPA